MTIAPGHKANLATLVAAARNGDLALLDCADAKTGAPVTTVVAVQRDAGGGATFIPLAKMFDGNPYNELLPPNPEGGYVAH